jgi:hypothetical protein
MTEIDDERERRQEEAEREAGEEILRRFAEEQRQRHERLRATVSAAVAEMAEEAEEKQKEAEDAEEK